MRSEELGLFLAETVWTNALELAGTGGEHGEVLDKLPQYTK